jgi:3-hydroxybutyryl-CoA dehydrogenase
MELQKLFVVGAGTMGSGIAQVGLQAGMAVTLCDAYAPQLPKAQAMLEKAFTRSVEKNHMTQAQKAAILERTAYTQELEAAWDADIVIEAVLENIDAKKEVFKQLGDICRPDAILASNTSTISITAIAAAVSRPERLVGTHFFNPAPVMSLLEIVKGLQTSEETIERVRALGERMGKACIVSKDSAGFIANHIGSPMLNAAVNTLDTGVGTREDIDAAMKCGWGFPMGPLELIDLVGVDVQIAVMEVLYAETGDPYYKPAPLLRRMAAAGHLGRKSGIGFYDYR